MLVASHFVNGRENVPSLKVFFVNYKTIGSFDLRAFITLSI